MGTLQAVHRPVVVLTSNNTRELSEALKRRCLYLFIDYPSIEQEMAVVRLKVPDLSARLARQAVELVHDLRTLDLRKSPSISETLDWAKALVTLNAKQLDRDTAGNDPERAFEARKRPAARPALAAAAGGGGR